MPPRAAPVGHSCHPMGLSSLGLSCLHLHVAMPPHGNVEYIVGKSSEPCGVKSFFLEDVGRSCIYVQAALDLGPRYYLLTQPWQESEMVFRAGLLSVPCRRSPQGKEARLGVSRLCWARGPDPFFEASASESVSPAGEVGLGLAMRSMALMSCQALSCNTIALSRWVLSSLPVSPFSLSSTVTRVILLPYNLAQNPLVPPISLRGKPNSLWPSRPYLL